VARAVHNREELDSDIESEDDDDDDDDDPHRSLRWGQKAAADDTSNGARERRQVLSRFAG